MIDLTSGYIYTEPARTLQLTPVDTDTLEFHFTPCKWYDQPWLLDVGYALVQGLLWGGYVGFMYWWFLIR